MRPTFGKHVVVFNSNRKSVVGRHHFVFAFVLGWNVGAAVDEDGAVVILVFSWFSWFLGLNYKNLFL